MQVEPGNSEDKMLVFFKLRPDVITENNLHSNILVSSMLDSPINMLYQAVRQVFAPVLLKVSYIMSKLFQYICRNILDSEYWIPYA